MRISTTINNEPTMRDYTEEFLVFKCSKELADLTLRDYRRTFDDFLTVSSNTTDYRTVKIEVAKFFKAIPNTSAAVYNRPYRYLNSFFNWMVKNDYLPKNPIKDLELTKRKEDLTVHSATIEDVEKLLKACNRKTFVGLRNYTMILLMIDTGIRTSEICRLTVADYNPKSKSIIITADKAKTRQARPIYLSDDTAAALNKYLRHLPKGIDYMFPSCESNRLTTGKLDKAFRRLCDEAGVKITPYQLRHSFATYWVKNGGNVFVLQKLMGHSRLNMTLRYTDIDESQKQEQHKSYSPINQINAKKRIAI